MRMTRLLLEALDPFFLRKAGGQPSANRMSGIGNHDWSVAAALSKHTQKFLLGV
jgi:hypothetical protein